MQFNNRLNRNIAKTIKLPNFLRKWALNRSIRNVVPMVGTAGIIFEKITCEELIVRLPNKKKIQNHIHQIHAAATALLAETATGIILGMSIPDNKLPLMKSLKVQYIKRSQGNQQAIATLSKSQIEKIRTEEKGDVNVSVHVTDETGEQIVIAEMIWAWIPKKIK